MGAAEDNMEAEEEEELLAHAQQQPMPLTRIEGIDGLKSKDIRILMDAGYHTVESVARATLKDLQLVNGISEQKADKLKAAAASLVPTGFTSAFALAETQAAMLKVHTGCKALDEILGGGIEQGSITEVYGEYRTGKSQLCHTLAVTCQLSPDKGGGEGKCLYIDTEGTFRPGRLAPIAERFKMNVQDVLENIAYARAHNTEHQTDLLAHAAAMMADSRFSLVIVDSVTNLYRSEYNGRGELSARQVHLGRFLRQLTRIAEEFQVAVLVTNQVQAVVDGGMAYGPTFKPIGGHILAHATTTRLQLQKGRGDTRKAKLICNPGLPERDALFGITEAGVDDANDK